MQPTTQRKFIQISEETDKKLKELNKDGTPVYPTELEASKAAATKIEESREEKNRKAEIRIKEMFDANPQGMATLIRQRGVCLYGKNAETQNRRRVIV